MALFICPECGSNISDQADICPHCGYKLSLKGNASKIRKRMIAIAAIILLVIGLCVTYYLYSPHTVTWFCKHKQQPATCEIPITCSRCGKTWGEALGHYWERATCTTPETCRNCGATNGTPKSHAWTEATCTELSTCKDCGITRGKPRGHNVKDYICTRCKKTIATENDVPNILDILSLNYRINYVGGIDQYLTFRNKSTTKTINYITVEIQYYNAVGDVLQDEIRHVNSASLKFTGPLAPGETSPETYWDACFYNATFSGTAHITEIRIEYSDKTTLVLDETIASKAVVDWR